jgi:hypothetical protein
MLCGSTPMKDYYLILGVERTATSRDIKRTYRRLAIVFHPDKNPTAEAEDRFKEINEAYMVLSDPEAKASYDARLANPGYYAVPDAEPWHRDPAYQRATSYRRAHGPSERRLFLESMLKYSRLLFYFGCFYSGVVIVDYLLPASVQDEVVITDMTKLPLLASGDRVDFLVTDRKHRFHVEALEMSHFPFGSTAHIYTSRILSAVMKIENHDRSYVVNNLASIYRNFSFAPIMLLLTCLTGLIIRRGLEFHVNLGIVVFLLMILNIVFLFTSRI